MQLRFVFRPTACALLFVLLLTLLLTACDKPAKGDRALRYRIIGTWAVDLPASNGVAVVTITREGQYLSRYTNATGTVHREYDAHWQIADGLLTTLVYRSEGTPPIAPTNQADQVLVTLLTKNRLECQVLTVPNGPTIRFVRKK